MRLKGKLFVGWNNYLVVLVLVGIKSLLRPYFGLRSTDACSLRRSVLSFDRIHSA